MKPNELTAADILSMAEFDGNLEDFLNNLIEQRTDSVERLERRGQKAKPTLFDWLTDEGLATPATFKAVFIDVLNKEAKQMTFRQREFVRAIGMEVYRRTLLPIVEAEKKNKDNQNVETKN